MPDTPTPDIKVKAIKIFSDEYVQMWPVNVLISLSPERGLLKVTSHPQDLILTLGLISYGEAKIREKLLDPGEKSNIIQPGAFGPLSIPRQ